MQVVRQEAQAHPHQDRAEQRRRQRVGDAVAEGQPVGVREEGQRRDADHAGREAVQAVDEVDRVDADHDQGDGDEGAPGLVQHHRAHTGDRQPQHGDALEDHDPGRDHLAAQLHQGVHAPLVVQHPDHPHDGGAGQQRGDVPGVGEDGGQLVEVGRHQQARAQAAEHGDAAEARSRLLVHVPVADLRHGAGDDREFAHRSGEQIGDRGDDAQRQQELTHQQRPPILRSAPP
jgi:hypothetical protein